MELLGCPANFNPNLLLLGNNTMNDIQLLAKEAASRCWTGYEAVPGKKPYSDGSCQPVGGKKKKKSEKRAALWDKLLRTGQLSEEALTKIYKSLDFGSKGGPRTATFGYDSGLGPDYVERAGFPLAVPEKTTGGFLGFGRSTEPAHVLSPRPELTRGRQDGILRDLRKGQTTGKPYAPMSDILKQLAASKASQKASRGSSKLDKKMFKKNRGRDRAFGFPDLPEKRSSMANMAIREMIERAGGKATPAMLDAFSQAQKSVPHGAGSEIKDLNRQIVWQGAKKDDALKQLQLQMDKMKQTGRQARFDRKAMQGKNRGLEGQNRGLESQVAEDARRLERADALQGYTQDAFSNVQKRRSIAEQNLVGETDRAQRLQRSNENLRQRPTSEQMQSAVNSAQGKGLRQHMISGGVGAGTAIGINSLRNRGSSQTEGSPSSGIAKAPAANPAAKPAASEKLSKDNFNQTSLALGNNTMNDIQLLAKEAAFEAYVKQAEKSRFLDQLQAYGPDTAILGGLAGAGVGGLTGLISPGEDEEGNKRSRLLAALRGAGAGGLLGGAMGGALPLAGGALVNIGDTVNERGRKQMQEMRDQTKL
jgi:hypothetical protein